MLQKIKRFLLFLFRNVSTVQRIFYDVDGDFQCFDFSKMQRLLVQPVVCRLFYDIGHFVFWSHHVTYRAPCHASGHLVIYRECYRLQRAFFTLRRFFNFHFFLLVSRLPWELAVQPQSYQVFMLMFKTQPRDGFWSEGQQSTKEIWWQVLFKGYGSPTM